MQYNEKTPSYNEKRYGKPWLAIVTTSLAKDFEFIDWSGRWGCAGEFAFDAAPGTMLAYGQKDMRKGRGGVGGYQICMPDGSLAGILDAWAAELRKLAPEARWQSAARKLLDRAVGQYRQSRAQSWNVGGYQEPMASADHWSRVLGIQSPIMAEIAEALGLIDHPTAAQAPAVSMEAFF